MDRKAIGGIIAFIALAVIAAHYANSYYSLENQRNLDATWLEGYQAGDADRQQRTIDAYLQQGFITIPVQDQNGNTENLQFITVGDCQRACTGGG